MQTVEQRLLDNTALISPHCSDIQLVMIARLLGLFEKKSMRSKPWGFRRGSFQLVRILSVWGFRVRLRWWWLWRFFWLRGRVQ